MLKKRITRARLAEGERVPSGYGVTYVDYGRKETVCHPVPLNRIIRWCYLAWNWTKYPMLEMSRADLEKRVTGLQIENFELSRKTRALEQEVERLRGQDGATPAVMTWGTVLEQAQREAERRRELRRKLTENEKAPGDESSSC